jgi:hypothetical protein
MLIFLLILIRVIADVIVFVVVVTVFALYSLCVVRPLLFVEFCVLCFVWRGVLTVWCVLFVCCVLLHRIKTHLHL